MSPPPPSAVPWTENRAGGRRGLDRRELWQYRELLWYLAARDVRVRYKQAALGWLWVVLRPVIGAGAFTVVFRQVADIPSDGIPYLPFAFVGFSAWSCVSSGVTTATASLVDNANLVTKVWFPRIIAPTAAVLPGLLDVTLSLALLGPLLLGFRINPGLGVLAAPLLLALLPITALSIGLWLAALNVQYRDVNHIVNLGLQVWLFLSPVAYPLSAIHGGARWLYALNPLAGLLEALRWSLLGGPWPGWALALSLGTMVLTLVGGAVHFQRVERRFADVI